MNFLYPGFLFALISVLIPIRIHLFLFKKFNTVYFIQVLVKPQGTNLSTLMPALWLLRNNPITLIPAPKVSHNIDAPVAVLDNTSHQTLVTKQHKGQEYWKLCLILSLVFNLLEILLVRFYTTNNRIQA
ncbi:MAG: hypothetical protein EOO99_06505 [Pedobacter sp.]|nr:MAG: hypothetical protein EOO99_06505 [Pedobacter sp.]